MIQDYTVEPRAGIRRSLASLRASRTVDRMILAAIINEIVDEISDFLEGTVDREQARTRIVERLEADYFQLAPVDRKAVSEAVMTKLEEMEHFETEFFGDPFKEEAEVETEPRE